jgi:uncharacterized membrane protein
MSPLRFAASFLWEVVLGSACFLGLFFVAFLIGEAVHWFEKHEMNRGMIVIGAGLEWMVFLCDALVFALYLVYMTTRTCRELWLHFLEIWSKKGSDHGASGNEKLHG